MKMQITAAVMIHGRLAPLAKTLLSSARAGVVVVAGASPDKAYRSYLSAAA
jgi:hypothetical protein